MKIILKCNKEIKRKGKVVPVLN